MIDENQPILELSNTNNNNSNNNRAEWKLGLIIKDNFISVRHFEDSQATYSASKPVEIFMGTDTEISLIHFLIRF